MVGDPTEGVVTKISEWIINMALLNLLWFLLTLLGGVLFGWAPATVAIMAVWRQQEQAMDKVQVIKAMWQQYRENFVKANAIGWIIKFFAALLVFYSFTLTHWEGIMMIFFAATFLMICVAFIIVCTFIFPVYIHYDLGFLNCFKYAFAIGLAHLHFVVIMVASLATIFWSYSVFPGLILVFFASLPSACITNLSLTVFKKIERKQSTYS